LSVGILAISGWRALIPHKAQDRQEEVAEAEQSVVAEDVKGDKEDVHVNTDETNDERVPTQIIVERNVVNAVLIDSNVQKNVVDENKISIGQEDVSRK